ncbi:hypothetical protein AN1V17_45330 [Vallitalea sediminicola]
MKRIIKGTEPTKLIEYRNTENASYKNLPTMTKTIIRNQLLEEQGYICCYCLSRIPHSKVPINMQMKIEHFLPESGETKSEELVYKNLFAACNGNEGLPSDVQQCDTHKKNNIITLNPLDEFIEDQFIYKQDGYLKTDDSSKQHEVDDILNLNNDKLVFCRKAAIDGTRDRLIRIKRKGIWNNDILQKEIDKLYRKHEGKYTPYCLAAIQYLKRKMI